MEGKGKFKLLFRSLIDKKQVRSFFTTKTAFVITGFVSSIWFLARVIAKPSRVAYPCMQAAAPIMSSFIIWCLSLLGMGLFYKKTKANFVQSKYIVSGLFALAFLIATITFIAKNSATIYANYFAPKNEEAAPIGVGKGIFPGRVVWAHNPDAALWKGSGAWYSMSLNPQSEYDSCFTAGIKSLSGGSDDATSWNKIFTWFNDSHGRAATGYQAGDKIAIKINMNNTADPNAAPSGIDANPQSCVACLRSLINAGIPQEDIWIGDPSRAVTDNVFNAIHSVYPNVNVVDYHGNNGRVKTTTVVNVFPNSDVVTGQSKCFYDARYIVNMPLLKGHGGQGITFGSKNFYGINGISNNWEKNGGRHPSHSALTNYMTNTNFGGKTILWVMDAMYPSRDLFGQPSSGWSGAPFNGKAAASFFMSLDGIAEESVSLDFFNQYYASEINENGGIGNAEKYMINAANAGAGVHEHWNNKTERKYSRNLNPSTNGIELIYITKPWSGNGPTSSNILKKENSGKGFKIFPNPAKDVLNVELNNSDITKIEIHTAAGLKVHSQFVSGNHIVKVDLACFKNGMYFITVFGDQILTEKFKI
jgi:hypothetical protein